MCEFCGNFRNFLLKCRSFYWLKKRTASRKTSEKLGFDPEVYSPNYSLVDELTVKYCRAKGIKIIPWTVNEIHDLERMKKFGLDGIITDYPNRAVKVFRN